MTWAAQIRALLSFPDNFWTNLLMVYLVLGSTSWFCKFCSEKSAVCTLTHLRFNLISPEIICKNVPLNISMIIKAKKRLVQHPPGGFFNFCIISVYGLECFICVWHDLLSRNSLTLKQSVKYSTRILIMVHHACNY